MSIASGAIHNLLLSKGKSKGDVRGKIEIENKNTTKLTQQPRQTTRSSPLVVAKQGSSAQA